MCQRRHAAKGCEELRSGQRRDGGEAG
jgi:hypothetical protein